MLDCKVVYWNGDVAVNCTDFRFRCVSARKSDEVDQAFVTVLDNSVNEHDVKVLCKKITDAVRVFNEYKR